MTEGIKAHEEFQKMYLSSMRFLDPLFEITKNWLPNAKIEDPEGAICANCGKENDFADDIGFFYVTGVYAKHTKPGALCRACHDISEMPPGDR